MVRIFSSLEDLFILHFFYPEFYFIVNAGKNIYLASVVHSKFILVFFFFYIVVQQILQILVVKFMCYFRWTLFCTIQQTAQSLAFHWVCWYFYLVIKFICLIDNNIAAGLMFRFYFHEFVILNVCIIFFMAYGVWCGRFIFSIFKVLFIFYIAYTVDFAVKFRYAGQDNWIIFCSPIFRLMLSILLN